MLHKIQDFIVSYVGINEIMNIYVEQCVLNGIIISY